MFILSMGVLVVAVVIVLLVRKGTVGRNLAAMRGSETATAGLGVNPTWQRIVVFALSGAIAGIGGVLYSIEQQHVSPVDWNTTFSLVLVVLVVTTSVNTVEGAIQAGIGLFVIEQLFTYLPSRFGGPSLTIVLFAFGALHVRPAPRGRARVPEAAVDHALRALVLRPRGRGRRSEGARHVGVWCQWLTSSRSCACKGVCKSFGGIQAVHTITFDVARRRERRPGRAERGGQDDAVQLRLRAAATRGRATSSSTGRRLTGMPTYKRARMGIGRTYQRVEVFTDMSVRDHLMVAERSRQGEGRLWRDLLNMSKPKPEEMERVEATLELVGISHLADTSVNALGLGHCRLVELARALATEPKILLADEPSSGLDLHETAEVAAVLRTVQRERGTAVLLVEHDLAMVAEVVDRTVVMDLGAMLFAGTFDECMADPAVRDAYLGQMGLA